VIAVITVMVFYRKCDSSSVFALIRKGWVGSLSVVRWFRRKGPIATRERLICG
jgi:hypothetical protein